MRIYSIWLNAGGISMHYATLYDIADHNPIPSWLALIMLYLIVVVFAIRAANHWRLFHSFPVPGGPVWLIVLLFGLPVTMIASSQVVIYTIYFRALSQGQYR